MSRKSHILQFLQKTGDWVSGQDIADELGISRAAVAKHISSLRADGHVIDSAPKRGYRLLVAADILELPQIESHLTTRLFGRGAWHFLESTASTSNELTLLALRGAAEGTVVTAEAQSHGKGRKGHSWFSAPRALQFSILVRPVAGTQFFDRLLHAATVAVAQSLAALYPLDVRVKYPNDILINRRKVAGVLIESGYRNEELDWVVIGIGCNVNTLREEFPGGLQREVTSPYAESGKWMSRNVVLATILNALEYWYVLLTAGETDRLEATWAQLCL